MGAKRARLATLRRLPYVKNPYGTTKLHKTPGKASPYGRHTGPADGVAASQSE